MLQIHEFETRLPLPQREKFFGLSKPWKIQEYLDQIPYIAEERDRSPLNVMIDGQAHCLDGAIFASLALTRLGYQPLIMDLVPEKGTDDDHVLALFKVRECWGCIAKSNYAFLRFREPIHRTLRELAMTFFESFTNVEKRKTLRGYTRPLDLSSFGYDWMWSENCISEISRCFYRKPTIPLISMEQSRELSLSDEKYYSANSLGTDFKWAFGIRENP